MDAKQIQIKINAIAKAGKKLDQDIQETGLAIIAHVEQFGDVTLADSLFNALPKGARSLALAEWFLAFGKLRTLPKDKQEGGRVFGYDKAKVTDVESATATPWYEFRKEPNVADAFDAAKAVAALIKKIRKARDEGIEVRNAAAAIAALKDVEQQLS